MTSGWKKYGVGPSVPNGVVIAGHPLRVAYFVPFHPSSGWTNVLPWTTLKEALWATRAFAKRPAVDDINLVDSSYVFCSN
jgi:hypothetical protein